MSVLPYNSCSVCKTADVKHPKTTRVEIQMPWLLHNEMLDSSLPKLLPSQHCQGKASLWPSPSLCVCVFVVELSWVYYIIGGIRSVRLPANVAPFCQ